MSISRREGEPVLARKKGKASPLEPVLVKRKSPAEFSNFCLYGRQFCFVTSVFQGFIYKACDNPHLSLFHPLCGCGGRDYPYAAGYKRAPCLKWYCVLVNGYACLYKGLLCLFFCGVFFC